MVDALAPDGSDQPLGEAVLPRRRQGAAAPTEERLTLERPQRSADPRHDAGVATGAGIFGPRAAKAAIEGMAERVAVPPNHPTRGAAGAAAAAMPAWTKTPTPCRWTSST